MASFEADVAPGAADEASEASAAPDAGEDSDDAFIAALEARLERNETEDDEPEHDAVSEDVLPFCEPGFRWAGVCKARLRVSRS